MLFGNVTNDAIAVGNLFQRRQQPNESLRDFAQAVYLLSQTAYPDDASLSARHATSVFATGLRDESIGKLLVIRSFPSVFAAQRFAEEIEAQFPSTSAGHFSRSRYRDVRRTEVSSTITSGELQRTSSLPTSHHHRSPPPSDSTMETALSPVLVDLTSALRELKGLASVRTTTATPSASPTSSSRTSRKEEPRATTQLKCWTCGGPHLQRHCPKSKNSSRSFQGRYQRSPGCAWINRQRTAPYQRDSTQDSDLKKEEKPRKDEKN